MAKTQVEVIHRLSVGELDLLMTIAGSRTTADLQQQAPDASDYHRIREKHAVNHLVNICQYLRDVAYGASDDQGWAPWRLVS